MQIVCGSGNFKTVGAVADFVTERVFTAFTFDDVRHESVGDKLFFESGCYF